MFDNYMAGVAGSRSGIEQTQFAKALLSGNPAREQVELFWVYYCGLGQQITAPVERWIATAGKKCVALGYTELGEMLIGHAHEEASHDRWMREDTLSLVEWRKQRGLQSPDPEELFARPMTPAMKEYVDLHEQVIDSDNAYAQIAIELEIEDLSKTHGKRLLDASEHRASGIRKHLTFVKKHAVIDVKHTELNEELLQKFLKAVPKEEVLQELISFGRAANRIYGAIFDECWLLAESKNQ